MQLSDLPYPLRLCAETLHYAIYAAHSQGVPCGEVKRRVESVFGAELVEEAFQALMGNYSIPPAPIKVLESPNP